MQHSLHDPGLHLFLDDEELQDYPGFARMVQRPERVQVDPVLRPERSWEGRTVQIKGGVHYDEEPFEEMVWNLATGYQGTIRVVTDPFRPYYRYFGTHQSWRMFVAPHRNPSILHIDVREGREWVPVYVEGSSEFTWMGETLDHDRVRSALFRYAWPGWTKNYRRLCDWLAIRAAADFPDASQVRFRYWKYRTPTPEQVMADERVEGRFHRRHQVDLTELRQ